MSVGFHAFMLYKRFFTTKGALTDERREYKAAFVSAFKLSQTGSTKAGVNNKKNHGSRTESLDESTALTASYAPMYFPQSEIFSRTVWRIHDASKANGVSPSPGMESFWGRSSPSRAARSNTINTHGRTFPVSLGTTISGSSPTNVFIFTYSGAPEPWV